MQTENNKTHLTKQKLLQHLSKKTGLAKKNVNIVFTELLNTIKEHMQKNGPEKFILPGVFKLTVKNVPAQKERMGTNPFTKKEMLFKAKPAARKIKIKALKSLKDVIK